MRGALVPELGDAFGVSEGLWDSSRPRSPSGSWSRFSPPDCWSDGSPSGGVRPRCRRVGARPGGHRRRPRLRSPPGGNPAPGRGDRGVPGGRPARAQPPLPGRPGTGVESPVDGVGCRGRRRSTGRSPAGSTTDRGLIGRKVPAPYGGRIRRQEVPMPEDEVSAARARRRQGGVVPGVGYRRMGFIPRPGGF